MRILSRRGVRAGRGAQRGGAQQGVVPRRALDRFGVPRNQEVHTVVSWEAVLREEEGRAVATTKQLVLGSRRKTAEVDVPHLGRL